MTRRLRFWPVILIAAALMATVDCSARPRVGRRVIVLGFDGLDYELTSQMIARGMLPGFAQLAMSGGFSPLGTTIPPQSPVAWSTFITGRDPGGHGIFDFIHRDPKTMQLFLSTTRTHASSWHVGLGRWQLPLDSGGIELMRKGQTFWEVLEARGVPTTIIRMPANFPPSGTASRELSGMGTPDLTGTYGTFSLFTSEPYAFAGQNVTGGTVYAVSVQNGVVAAALDGPDNPFVRTATKVRAGFTAHLDQSNRYVKIAVGDEAQLLKVGEWSDWVPVQFTLAPTQTIKGQVRFYLKSLAPYFALYASPVNIDPLDPALPVSHPERFAADLARTTGRFYTQGMPEDTSALRSGVLTDTEFLAQARLAADETRRQYQHVLGNFQDGLLFYYFGHVDQVSHVMWRSRDRDHPAYDPVTDARNERVIEQLYQELDGIVTDTLARLDEDDLLVVMSDHGFTSWRRAFHMNSWLRDHGYLSLSDSGRQDEAGYFANVDWSRTRAYAVGLNGLYINVRGRERDGIVDPAQRAAVAREIAGKLLAEIDPATGQQAITKMYHREEIYEMDGNEDLAPDLVVGYAKGTRGSDESALGALPAQVIVDNVSHWSGDHCMDHETVPGILLSNRPLRKPPAGIQGLAAAVLAEFGIEMFPQPTEGH